MSYYWFNRKEIWLKAKERYSKQKAAEYYLENKEAMSKEKRDKIKEHQGKIYQQLIQYKKEALQNIWALFLVSIRINEKTLKFDNIRVNEKECHKSKQPINLDLINVHQTVVSSKFKHNDNGFKYFIGYKEGEIVKPWCIILPQMIGHIKYFENRGKHVLCNQRW